MNYFGSLNSFKLSFPLESVTKLLPNEVLPTPFIGSPLIPLLLLSLAKQKYQPETKDVFKSEYDYIIVGAGTSGSVVASRLSEKSCVNVLLLEAGQPPPRLTEVPGVAQYYFTNPNATKVFYTTKQIYASAGARKRRVPIAAGRGPGGSSNVNGLVYTRGNHADYDLWEAQGATGWSWKDVFPYFKKLEDNRNQEFVNNGYHGVGGPVTVMKPVYHSDFQRTLNEAILKLGYTIRDSNGARQLGFFEQQSVMRNSQRCSTAKAYLVPAEHRKNLDIVTGAFVKKVIIQHGQATGVEFDFKNTHFEVMARREVILSAGTVNTPKLLMLSGIGPRKYLNQYGIDVIADLPVGSNLQDQPYAFRLFTANRPIVPFVEKLAHPFNMQTYISKRAGPLASPTAVAKIAFLRKESSSETEGVPDFELIFLEPDYFSIGNQTYLTNFLPLESRPSFICYSILMHPRSRGYVRIKSRDPYVDPLINPNYLKDPRDVEDLVAGLKTCDKILTSKIMRKKYGLSPISALYPECEIYESEPDRFEECYVKTLSASIYHVVGTAKMGHRDDPLTVVDPELRVKGIRNLRVVDASVMPTMPSGHTEFPTIMIGEKASDMIKKSIHCV